MKDWPKVTVTLAVSAALALGGAGYTVGLAHARVTAHEHAEGHPALIKRVREQEQTMAKVAMVLELLREEQRARRR